MTAPTKPHTRKQVIEDARRAALEGQWEEAIRLNRQLIERDPRDVDAHNRLGRAYLEFRDVAGAYEAFSSGFRVDPANLIARRNLQRLELLREMEPTETSGEPVGTDFPRTSVFIEEVGKTWVTELANPAPLAELAQIYAGQKLTLAVENDRLSVMDAGGRRVGEIEAKAAQRVIDLMNGGNQYDAYALGLSSVSLRVILREVVQAPELEGKVSFPRQISATRAFLRDRDRLRLRDEADFFLDEDEDEEADETTASADVEEDDENGDEEVFGKADQPVVAENDGQDDSEDE